MSTLRETGIKSARGYKQYVLKQDGYALSYLEMIKAKCFDCCQGFIDGTADCECPDCELYEAMPYRKVNLDLKPKKSRPKKEMSEKQKEIVNKMLAARNSR